MTETRLMVACPECNLFWAADAAPGCSLPEHASRHRSFEFHLHRTALQLPDGTVLMPVSFDTTAPYQRMERPDFGLYLDQRWQPPWPHHHLDWPDFGVPSDPSEVLHHASVPSRKGPQRDRVEIGCLGGHGRTGTALAVLRGARRCPI